ncbi:MAG TPA: methyltransferase domain-containing protein [Candidatus Baltobacteraceae bacterium]|nr:methyltransferase domain-containing protein [Candidatus Baltobacteraceae bacterium]
MHIADAQVYRCPETGEPLALTIKEQRADEVIAGEFRAPNGAVYAIEDAIPDLTFPPVLREEDAFARRTYDTVADVYDAYLPLTFKTFSCEESVERNRMVDRLRLQPGQRVLEVGAGTGRTSAYIAERLQGNGHIYVHDISRGILGKAVERLASEPVKTSFLLSNGVYLPFPAGYFDAVFHFGGLNMFSDVRRGLSEMSRVVRPGGRVVVGDESIPPWLRDTELARILINSSSHFACPLPIADIPIQARDVVIEYIMGEVFYLISFTVGVGEPTANLDLEIPGARGGTHLTRMYGQLEGVTATTKELALKAREKKGVSMHKWLDEVVRQAAQRDLEE